MQKDEADGCAEPVHIGVRVEDFSPNDFSDFCKAHTDHAVQDISFAQLGRDVLGIIALLLPIRDVVNLLTLTAALRKSYLSPAFDVTFLNLLKRDFPWAIAGEEYRARNILGRRFKLVGKISFDDFKTIYRSCFLHIRRRKDTIAIPVMALLINISEMTQEFRTLYCEEEIIFEAKQADDIGVVIFWHALVPDFRSFSRLERWSFGPFDILKKFGRGISDHVVGDAFSRQVGRHVATPGISFAESQIRGNRYEDGNGVEVFSVSKYAPRLYSRIRVCLATGRFDQNGYPNVHLVDDTFVEPSFHLLIHYPS